MNRIGLIFGRALLVLVVLCFTVALPVAMLAAPAAAPVADNGAMPAPSHSGKSSPVFQVFLFLSTMGLGAAVVVTYTYPVTGVTPPTAAQAFRENAVTATIAWLDADTTAPIIHNWKNNATDRAQQFPVPIVNVDTQGTAVPQISIVNTDSSTMTINKVAGAGTGGTVDVVLLRPHTLIR